MLVLQVDESRDGVTSTDGRKNLPPVWDGGMGVGAVEVVRETRGRLLFRFNGPSNAEKQRTVTTVF